MARQPRLCVPGHVHHLIHRGNNRQTVFATTADFERMLSLLHECAAANGVSVHAYVLMGNHTHLLVTPSTGNGMQQMMKEVARRYSQYFNAQHGRSGTVWEGRYRSSIVDTDAYLLACMAYIDLNPVRAGLCLDARDHPWSSHGHYAGLRVDPLVTPHALVWSMGNTPFAREAAYRALVEGGVRQQIRQTLTDSVLSGWVSGGDAFKQALAQQTTRRLDKTKAGRPTKTENQPFTT